MTTQRVASSFASTTLVKEVLKNRAEVNRYSQEVSTGLKVRAPGESSQSGTISQFQEMLTRIDGYTQRITTSTSMLTFQDDILVQANEIIARAKEIATQGANSTNSEITRSQQAAEVYQLRDQMATLANSTYQGRYIYGGAADDLPPFATQPYPAPNASESQWVFDNNTGSTTVRTAQVTDDVSLSVTTSGDQIFTNALEALERLARALEGNQVTPAVGSPASLTPYTFPDDLAQQTQDIAGTIDLLETARATEIMPERVSIGARIKRLETAQGLMELNKTSAQKVLDDLQNADVVESASKLTYAQTAFEASLQVTLRALNLSILNYL